MADTKRDKATLLAALADNTTGDISPQDLRDLLESLDLSRGACYQTANALTGCTLQGSGGAGGTNYYALQGTTQSKTANRFTHATPYALTYTGTPTIKADIEADLSLIGDTAGDVYGVQFFHNAVALPSSYQAVAIETATTGIVTISLRSEANLATGDVIDIRVANETSAANILTAHAGYLNVREMLLG